MSRFYLMHRESVDLNFFTNNQELNFTDFNIHLANIGQKLKLKIIKQVTGETYLQYIYENAAGQALKVDLLKDFSPRFGKVKTLDKIRVDSLENIAVNKIMAIIGRTDTKDFIDFYFLLKTKELVLSKLINMAKKKNLGFTEFYFANALTLLENAHIYPKMLVDFDREDFKKFYKDLSRNLFLTIKPKPKN